MHTHLIPVCLLALSFGSLSPVAFAQSAAPATVAGSILSDNAVAAAETGALQNEVQVFETIRQGIALSLSMCDLTEKCSPVVSHDELRRLVATVENRIEQLVMRHAETQDAEIEGVLIAYADIRDSYAAALQQLNSISPEPVRKVSFADALGGTEEDLMPPEYAVFEDIGEPLSDDGDAPVEAPPDPLEE